MAAAVLLVGALTTALLWLSSKDPLSNPYSSIGKKTESKTNSVKPTAPSLRSISPMKQKTAGQSVSKKKNRTAEKNDKKVHTILRDQNKVTRSIIRTEEPQQSPAPSAPVATTAGRLVEEKPVVLVYRLETIGLQQVVASTSAPEPKENSRLLKVINFAREAKNGDGGLGDLRQAKDELFAFNFIKDKPNNHK